MLKKFKETMAKIVTNYLICPNKTIEKKPLLESILSCDRLWFDAIIDGRSKKLIQSNQTEAPPKTRTSSYRLQGMGLPLFKRRDRGEPFEKAVNLVVLFISGSNSHLFSCRQRAIECAYAAKTAFNSTRNKANVLLSRFNPFGVVNTMTPDHALLPYEVYPLSQEDITNDYSACAQLMLEKFKNAELVIMGHSLGGVFARKVFEKLSKKNYVTRVKFVYSAMSLPGIADAFMYYQPSQMLKNIIPKKNKALISSLINMINRFGFQCIQRALKKAVESSGWKTIAEDIHHSFLAQSNIEKKNIDTFIPDQVASVQEQNMMNWLLSAESHHNCHDLPPSKLFYSSLGNRCRELDKLIAALKMIFVAEAVKTAETV